MTLEKLIGTTKSLAEKGLSRNILLSAAQSIIAIIALFISYRTVVSWLGKDMLGIWSLIGAFTISIRLLDVSSAAVVGRFIAIATARQNDPSADRHPIDGIGKPSEYADTSVFILLAFYSTICLLAWYPMSLVLASQLDNPAQAQIAIDLLPAALILTIILVFGTSCADALDGIHRADLRSGIMIVGYLAMLVMVLLLVPRLGLLGLVLAQIFQFSLVAILARLILRQNINQLGFFPRRFSVPVMQEMVSYGLKVQIAGLANFLADPLTRILINQYGSLSSLATYELASKFVVQIRSIVAAGAIPLIPVFAVSKNLSDENSIRTIRKANRIMFIFSFSLIALSAMGSPVIGMIVVGGYDSDIVHYAIILAIGYAVNTLGLPLYLYAQAQGRLKWNIIGQFMIGLTTLSLSPILVTFFGQSGVVLAFSTGLSVAGSVFICLNAIQFNVRLREL